MGGGHVEGQLLNERSDVVGATGFEPATLCSQSRCATRLRYAPTLKNIKFTAVFFGRSIVTVRFLVKPVAKLSQYYPVCPKIPVSLAERFNFCSASRFICNSIREYFLTCPKPSSWED